MCCESVHLVAVKHAEVCVLLRLDVLCAGVCTYCMRDAQFLGYCVVTVTVYIIIQSNLTITNHLRTTEKVQYIRVFTTYIKVFTTSGCSLHQGVHYIRVFTTSGCSLYQGVHYVHQGVHYIRVFTTSGCSLHQGVHYIRVFTTSGCSLH